MSLVESEQPEKNVLQEISQQARMRHLALVESLDDEMIAAVSAAWIETLKQGKKILFCGNGGSAADAQHFATELSVRYSNNGPALAGLALTTDSSVLTACGNDFGFEQIFARQVEALGNEGDLLVGISTSGASANVLAAFEQAKRQGVQIMGFCGENAEKMHEYSKLVFSVASTETARIQECHAIALHIACESVEKELRP